jgi:arylamine N-acetyltransferase
LIPAEQTDEILESLDLSRAQPGLGFLEALFVRFNARVPFENATKILRDREVATLAEKPRTPEIFWADHLEHGSGGTCFARVAAFDALLSALGFRTRRLLGRVERDGDHAGLAVETPAGEVLADVGFPLPALLPAHAETVETALAELAITRTPRGTAVAWLDGVPEGPRALELFSETVSEESFAEHWRRTFHPGSRFLQRIAMRRDLENRSVSYAGGWVRVDDRHSRLRVPLSPAGGPASAGRLSELFGVDSGVLERAFALVGEEETSGEPTLTAYLEAASSPDAAYARIASPEGYRSLAASVAEILSEEPTAAGFRLTFGPPGAPKDPSAAAVDEVSPQPSSRRIRLERRTRASASPTRSAYAAETRGGKTYLLRELSLGELREDLLRNDSLRGRLAGSLALDLLAWARLL